MPIIVSETEKNEARATQILTPTDKLIAYSSYGGVPFFLNSIEFHTGREIKIHSFSSSESLTKKLLKAVKKVTGSSTSPVTSSEVPLPEDFGATVVRYIVKGYFLESRAMPDPISMRNLFQRKVNNSKAFILILPDVDKVKAVSGKMRTIFSNTEGIENFTVIFYRAADNVQPLKTENTQSIVTEQSSKVKVATQETMEEIFNVTSPTKTEVEGIPVPEDAGVDKYVAEETQNNLQRFADYMKTFAGQGKTIVAEFNTYTQKLNAYSNDLSRLMQFPGELATATVGTIVQLTKIFTRPIDALNSQIALFQNIPNILEEAFGITLDKLTLKRNNSSFESLIKNVSASEMTEIGSSIDYDSSEQAIGVRDQISSLIEDLQLDNGNDPERYRQYSAMRDLLAASTVDLTTRSAQLPFVERVSMPESLPLLVIAYGLYEDATRFEEISTRNSVKNNMTPQTDLEVLSE